MRLLYELLRDENGMQVYRIPSLREDSRGALFGLTTLAPDRPHVVSVTFSDNEVVRGDHYHLGTIVAYDPSMMLIVLGKFLVEWGRVESGKLVGELHNMVVEPGHLLVIERQIFHRVTSTSVGGGMLAELVMHPDDVNSEDVYRLAT